MPTPELYGPEASGPDTFTLTEEEEELLLGGIHIENSPDADLLFLTEIYIANGLPVPPTNFFADWSDQINNASADWKSRLKTAMENLGKTPGNIETFADFIAALES